MHELQVEPEAENVGELSGRSLGKRFAETASRAGCSALGRPQDAVSILGLRFRREREGSADGLDRLA